MGKKRESLESLMENGNKGRRRKGRQEGVNRKIVGSAQQKLTFRDFAKVIQVQEREKEAVEERKLTGHVRFRQQGAWVSCSVRS